ncbi:DUF6221 family protein [Streptomyces sp. NPDC096153]|uniref:DUF6221 family protein n=1 Tax=Streptomyces sp. NPDC096153 TaxID=3155548 RepID=UPI00332C5A15
MSAELVAFLRARLDETKAATLRARDGHDGPCVNYVGQEPDAYDEYDSCALHLQAAEATPYRDASFGLADVEAKWLILSPYVAVLEERASLRANMRQALGRNDDEFARLHREESELIETERRLRPLVMALALPYADHSDHRDDW